MARKYFGRDAPLGETLLMKISGSTASHALSVAAVIEDLPPSGTHLTSGIFVSSQAPWTQLLPAGSHSFGRSAHPTGVGSRTYVKFAPHASAQRMLQAMPTLAQTVFTATPKGWAVALNLVRMDRLDADPLLNPGFSSRLLMLAIVGSGILFIAGINFVNLLTARSARRAKEVGVRKLAGALRRVLMMQFLAESMAYVIAASLVAVALVELLLPYANDFLIAGAKFRYWQDPALLGCPGVLRCCLGRSRVHILRWSSRPFVPCGFCRERRGTRAARAWCGRFS